MGRHFPLDGLPVYRIIPSREFFSLGRYFGGGGGSLKGEKRRFLSVSWFASYFLAAEARTDWDLVLFMTFSALLQSNGFSFWGFFPLFVLLLLLSIIFLLVLLIFFPVASLGLTSFA